MSSHENKASQTRAPQGMKSPGRVMSLCLLTAAATFATTLPTWINASVSNVLGEQTLLVAGKDASAAVSALAIVAVVASVVLRIAGAKVRLLIAALMVLSGVAIIASAWAVLQNPAQASLATTSMVTGTTELAGEFELTIWPWLTIACAAFFTLASAWAAYASRYWPVKRKYDRAAVAQDIDDMDEIDTWDSLSAGEDPTDRH